MPNPYYTPTGNPPNQTRGTSALVRNEFDSIEVGFDDVYAEILALAAAIGVAVTVSEVPLASASTTDIGNGYGPALLITGSNPINSFGANYKGGIFLRFQGSLQINHSAALQCPGGLNITTQADDACIAVPIGDPANGWRIMAYCRVSQGIIDDIAVKTSSTYANPSWLTSLAWSKITGRPTTLAGYGITDAPQKDGTGATGTWGINITGSAASIAAAVTASGLTMATNRLLGRTTAATGAIEELTQAQLLTFLGATVTGQALLQAASAAAARSTLAVGEVLLQTQTVSGVSAVDFTSGIDSTYDHYILRITDLAFPTNASYLLMRFSTDGGSSFISSNGYIWNMSLTTDGANGASAGIPDSSIRLLTEQSNVASVFSGGSIELVGLSGSRYKGFNSKITYARNGANIATANVGGWLANTSPVNGIRLLPSVSATLSGTFSLYGVRK